MECIFGQICGTWSITMLVIVKKLMEIFQKDLAEDVDGVSDDKSDLTVKQG